ncbi:hypothetical protein BC828DRAFT_40861 [Blastocladiella britannica]|nr:hypothetical protein BC828DRAFT_40861 [Blastocladiella britannica]
MMTSVVAVILVVVPFCLRSYLRLPVGVRADMAGGGGTGVGCWVLVLKNKICWSKEIKRRLLFPWEFPDRFLLEFSHQTAELVQVGTSAFNPPSIGPRPIVVRNSNQPAMPEVERIPANDFVADGNKTLKDPERMQPGR